jgi:hypothetical protein
MDDGVNVERETSSATNNSVPDQKSTRNKTMEEVKSEVDIFFLDDCSDGVTDANDVTRGGRPPDATTKKMWENVCTYLDLGIDTARAKIIRTDSYY